MCFRPPTVAVNDSICPKCGHENFIGVTKCAKCGEALNSGPVGTASADSRDWTSGLEFERQGAPGAPRSPRAPKAPQVPKGPKPPQP